MKIQHIVCYAATLLTVAAVNAENTPRTITVPFIKKSVNRNTNTFLQSRAVGSDKLYNYAGTAYLISVDIGTPPQTFDVVLDTGSADFWVPGTSCSNILCPSTKFNENNSSTFKSLSTKFNITYALGYSVGTYATDTVTVGGISVANQAFGVANTTDSVIQLQQTASVNAGSEPGYINGILGLGYPALTYSSRAGEGNYNPFVFNLVSQKLIDSPVFSIYLSSTSQTGWTGEITFGGTDNSKYQGNITYFSVVPATASTGSNGSPVQDYYYWMVYAGGLGVTNSPTQNLSFSASNVAAFILDTGTSLTYLPTSIAKSLVYSMTGSAPLAMDTASGTYIVDCNAKSSAVFQLKMFQSKDFSGNPLVLNVPLSQLLVPTGQKENGVDLCMFGIAPSDTTVTGKGLYLVGDTILRSMYMVFDMEKDRIGLAAATGSGSSISVDGSSTSNSTSPSFESGGHLASSGVSLSSKIARFYSLMFTGLLMALLLLV